MTKEKGKKSKKTKANLKATYSSGVEISMEVDKDNLSLLNDIEKPEDLVKKLKDFEFADIRNKKGGDLSRTSTILDEYGNIKSVIKVSDGKNINENIDDERVRNLKVITVGYPSKLDTETLRFLTGK